MTRADAIRRIKAALRTRTGRAWSVTGGRGTAYGWIHVASFEREFDGWQMTEEHRAILGRIFHRDGSPVPCQYYSIDPGNQEYAVALAEGAADAQGLYRAPGWD